MTRVDFYHGAADKLATALRLVHKAYSQRLPLWVYAADGAVAKRFDQLLWTTPALSFIPHCEADSPLAADTPVLIASQLDPTAPLAHDQLIINLDAEVPPGFARFQRVIEIVGNTDADKAPARSRAKFYKDRGYELNWIDLARKQ